MLTELVDALDAVVRLQIFTLILLAAVGILHLVTWWLDRPKWVDLTPLDPIVDQGGWEDLAELQEPTTLYDQDLQVRIRAATVVESGPVKLERVSDQEDRNG